MKIKDISSKYEVSFVHSVGKFNCVIPRLKDLSQLDGTVDCILAKIDNLVNSEDIKDLSCSSIRNEDNNKCLFLPIGVILKDGIITYASPTDNGTNFADGKPITLPTKVPLKDQIDNAINHDSCSYNEFLIDNPKVNGIYINKNDPRLYIEIYDISNFIKRIKHFELPIFTFNNGKFEKLELG